MADIFIWSMIGITLLVIECFFMQGIGIIFAGMSAITVSVITFVKIDTMYDATGTQLMLFIGLTFAWGLALWAPLNFYGYGSEDRFKNIIGAFGTVYEAISKDEIGSMSYAGVLVKARLDPSSKFEALEPKTHVKITYVDDDGVHLVKSIREEVDMSSLMPKRKRRAA